MMLISHATQRAAIKYARHEAADADNGAQSVLLTSGNTLTFSLTADGKIHKELSSGWAASGDRHCGPKAYAVAVR